MNRTTEKYTHYEEYMSNVPEKAHHAINAAIYEELYKLEDIEEELGISLIKLFKALKGIWVKSTNGDVYYVGNPYLCFSENEKRELELQFRVGDTWYKIKDYRKTWALSREELENENQNKTN